MSLGLPGGHAPCIPSSGAKQSQAISLIVATGVLSGPAAVTNLISCIADSDCGGLKIRLHNSSKSSITISGPGGSVTVIGNVSVTSSKQSSHSSTGTGGFGSFSPLLNIQTTLVLSPS